MTVVVYKQLLANNLRQSACEIGLKEFILMQDNDPKYILRFVSNWLDDKDIQVLDWLQKSPDLNPIEAVLALVKYKLVQIGKFKKDELKEKIKEIWYNIPVNLIQKYVNSFQKRCLEVFKTKGYNTKY
ncbi:TCB2 [Hepatospora eriocheir]|uniref:TCB2 n=1 Tax=Hepatospora eriocheir TaxID=1081669 RepID=A0A1X0QEJ3_9MICR|nr:TCB2 [Hepatospora eriocheir]